MTRTPHTLHTRLVAEAMERNDWKLAHDGPADYRSQKTWTEQRWTRPSRFDDDTALEVLVRYNVAGHVTSFVTADGSGAHVHGEGRTRIHGWRERFTPRMCRDLLIDLADEKRLTREDLDEAQEITRAKFAKEAS